ncbi:DNA helicase [Rhodospirillaceae bacterium KN72]|uniref:DNA helicase n=1 Tax=Pacificispira spongiicola TaxID=2729598 RepID=A0A7Y0HG72_9PROT|nr:DNA helicase [Pacificispira spongiicola]NMM45353.1 DNA helicase [Pacificispira spongiicola]
MTLSAPIYRLKRQAKLRSRETGMPLHAALDEAARREGFRNWNHLSQSIPDNRGAAVFRDLMPGDFMLLGARPGQGKTLLGLEIAVAAVRAGWDATFFTLDYTAEDVVGRLRSLGIDPTSLGDGFHLDMSDEICAEYMIARLEERSGRRLAVIDYLQLLDQRRDRPILRQQVEDLKVYLGNSGSIGVAISQVDRAFDAGGKAIPDLTDLRLPNPVDVTSFTKSCFLHDGRIEFSGVA